MHYWSFYKFIQIKFNGGNYMDLILKMIDSTNTFLWSYILIVMLISLGIYFTLRTKLVQFRYFGEKLANIFRTKKFIEEKYEEDKQLIIDKYNELGYRDALIVVDSVTPFDDRTVDVYMRIEEGDKYYVRNIDWVGNTVYNSDYLAHKLRMKKGDVYNQKLLKERISEDDDAIGLLDATAEDYREYISDGNYDDEDGELIDSIMDVE